MSSCSSTHLIITALIVSDDSFLNRIVKNVRRNKFKKELKNCSEIKGNKASRDLKFEIVSKLNEIENLKVVHIIFEKQSLKNSYHLNNKHKLYNCIAGNIAKCIHFKNCDLIIHIDKSKGKQALIDDFNQYLTAKFKEAGFCNELSIFHSNSQSWSGLQLADILAWSESQKICRNNTEYISLLDAEKQIEYDVFKDNLIK
ncbi:hypothetical protein MmiEs2_13910 [Methanimicrococcus stummii]|uniref:DUF3800 domain-containing protein n=2 Tax=Methanimicrococcus stummii TaxID=3028294 RepID=A0AA97A8K2_9EURY|nr:hypothetical protein MmiEs2_13910 [Methanimicrococcus sp. Es2]